MSAPSDKRTTPIVVTAADLPLHCPTASMKLWNSHPRVFIDVTTTGEAKCPYCGTAYKFDGPAPSGH
jgi:uncharacterized Zn-finger protein